MLTELLTLLESPFLIQIVLEYDEEYSYDVLVHIVKTLKDTKKQPIQKQIIDQVIKRLDCFFERAQSSDERCQIN